MRLVLIVVAIFCAYLTGTRIAHPFIDGDLFWQRQLGEFVLAHHAIPNALGTGTFTAVGAPWTAQEWLLGTLVALAFRAHAVWALSLLAGLAVFIALTVTVVRCKRAGASLYAALAAMLFAGICLEGPFAIRAQVLAWPLLALLLLALDGDGYAALWAIPVTIAWLNVHASAMLAVPVVWLDAAAYAWRRTNDLHRDHAVAQHTQRTRRKGAPAQRASAVLAYDAGMRVRLLLCVAVPLAVLCTPLGMRLPLYALMLVHSPIRQFIAEWQPMTGLSTQIVAGMLPLLAIVLYGIRRAWHVQPRDVALTLFMAAWTVLAVRNIALFALVAAVPASLAIAGTEGWFDPLASRGAVRPGRVIAALVLGLALVPVAGWAAYHMQPFAKLWNPPRRSIAALAAQPGEHRLLCTDFSWCALALGAPNVRVFLDGRADPYPLPVWRNFITVASMAPGWQAVLTRYRVNAVVAARNDPLATALAGDGWQRTLAGDSCCALFTKPIR